jgi:hypothetical protein
MSKETTKATVRVGRYVLRSATVEVWLSDADGSSGIAEWTEGGFGKIVVGCGADNEWSKIVQSLTHEALEVAIHIQGGAYLHSGFMVLRERCSSNYRFFFTHEDLQVIANSLGDFLCYCLPDLAKAWKKFKS